MYFAKDAYVCSDAVQDGMFNRHGHLVLVCLSRWLCAYRYQYKPKVGRIIDSSICIVSDFGFVYFAKDAVRDYVTMYSVIVQKKLYLSDESGV